MMRGPAHIPMPGGLRRSRRLLVLRWDLGGMRAALIRRRGRSVEIARTARSSGAQREAALRDCLAQLRQAGGRLPARAILLTPEVTPPAGVGLPVNPRRPRPRAQMEQMIRWELEPQIAQHGMARPIGAILRERGYLNAQQVRQILETMNQPTTTGGTAGPGTGPGAAHSPASEATGTSTRFGETALRLGLIERPQLDEGLAIQQQLQLSEERYVCGWTARPGDTVDEEGTYRWLACCIEQSVRRRWAELTAAEEIELLGVYPVVGTAAAANVHSMYTGRHAVIEHASDLLACTAVRDGRVEGVETADTGEREPTWDDLAALVETGEPIDRLWLATGEEPLRSAAEEAARTLGTEVRVIERPRVGGVAGAEAEPDGQWRLAAVGAARHAMGLAGPSASVCVPGREPGPPVIQRPTTWWAAAALVVAAGIGGHELWYQQAREVAVAERESARERLAKLESRRAELEQVRSRADELTRKLEQKRKTIDEVRARIEFLSGPVTARTGFAGHVLEALSEAATPETAINRVRVGSGGALELTGWAMSERAAQRFIQRLAETSPSRALSPHIRAEEGRLGLAGYAIELTLKVALPRNGEAPGRGSGIDTASGAGTPAGPEAASGAEEADPREAGS